MRVSVGWASDELITVLARLTSQQARGVVRIVEAELEGRSLSSLLDTPGQICTSTTYYGSGKRRGWKDNEHFQRSLELARRDYRQWLLEHSTGEALAILASTAPEAVRALRQEIVGNMPAIRALEVALQASEPELRANAARRLGETGLSMVVPALMTALQREQDPGVRSVLVDALGAVAGFRDGERRLAATSVLDRAAVETAAKQALLVSENDIDAAIERELARLAGDGQDDASGAAAANADSNAL